MLFNASALSKTVLRHHRCSVGGTIDIKEDVVCKPRLQVVSIPKTQPHDVFSPTSIVVNRCSGGCPNMRGCTPKVIESKCVLKFLAKECVCACKDDSEAAECTDKGRDWDPINCNCMCPKELCISTKIWSTETCRCEDEDKSEIYFA
ncbi:hypothetical protein J437_LFUL008126 [Ladona fulva]|uniref:Uncharacterized protein n=1 Tax=Ladona fulva TaxID=123851 RepID=A0A8K0JU53_LADFU|nr:hypothetical protein J437_LFUL008126 [Ladona fulva]